MLKLKKKKLIIFGICAAVLVATLVAELFVEMHTIPDLEGKLFFHAWYGFICCMVIVIFSKIFGFIVKRGEEYYK